MKELGKEQNVLKLPLLTRAAPKSSPMGWDLAEWCIGQVRVLYYMIEGVLIGI